MIALNKELCTGCEACCQICPACAIRMEQDEEGFRYPKVDAKLCTNCNACREHCPVYAGIDKLFQKEGNPACYAAWALDENSRMEGSSGGVFGELARYVLENGGYVCGAAFAEDHSVEHRIICRMDELRPLKKSKYLQSRIGTVFEQIRGLLDAGETVLFTGTPCQCAGLRAYLGEKAPNLILCDFVCHGVNSPLVHQTYIRETEKALGVKLSAIDHRDKAYGWGEYQFSAICNGEKQFLGGKRKNPFLRGFLTDLYLRPACYSCAFKGISRPVDLTLGDCWGYEGYTADTRKGVSLVLVHSQEGQRALDEIDSRICLATYPLEKALAANPSLWSSAKDRFAGRYTFFDRMEEIGSFKDTIFNYLGKI